MTIQRVSISQQIRKHLLDRIACGRMQPGDRIIEAQVASEMSVSSIPVREAIRELVAMGILQFAPHHGAWVRKVSLLETIQAFEVRSVLEPLAVESAARRLQGKCNQLRQVAKQIVDAAKVRDFASFQHHNQVFHRAIAEASDNQVLLRVWDSLAFEVRTRFTMDYLTTVDPVAIAREHKPIVTALDRGDAKEAAALLRSHSRELVEYLRAQASLDPDGLETPRGRPGRDGQGRSKETRAVSKRG